MYKGERLNSITHLMGLVFAIPGSIILVERAMLYGDVYHLISFGIFALSMIVLYAASFLYHCSRGGFKAVWAKVDHCAIFLLIAGTYTPFALVTLHGLWGSMLCVAVWVLALVGIGKELWWGRETAPSVPLYLLMGWLGLATAVPLVERLSAAGLIGLVLGAVLYTVGVLFYVNDKHWRHAHGVWHLFVLAGTTAHYITVLNFVR